MHLHAEHWRARPAWCRLPSADRQAYLEDFRSGCTRACDPTLCLVRLAVGDVGDGYLTVWRIVDDCGVAVLNRFLDEVGWTHYFAPTPARCTLIPLSSPVSGLSASPMRKTGT